MKLKSILKFTGVGLVLKELAAAGHQDDTLVIYTSDNGPSLPAGRTNLYDPGMREPMFISSPTNKKRRNQVTYAMTSLLDIVPTMLDWYNIKTNFRNDMDTNSVDPVIQPVLTGKSLLPLLANEPPENPDDAIYASQSYHEITMNYPMRAIRTKRYKLIHNLNYRAPFPVRYKLFQLPEKIVVALGTVYTFSVLTLSDRSRFLCVTDLPGNIAIFQD